jgi:hypothetical protein
MEFQIKTRRLSESDRKGFHLNLITFVWGFMDWGRENRVKWLLAFSLRKAVSHAKNLQSVIITI